MLKNLLKALVDIVFLPVSLVYYFFTGQTIRGADRSLVRSFCRTGGTSNDVVSALISRYSKPIRVEGPSILGDISQARISSYADELRETGVLVLEGALDPATCDRLLHYATTSTLWSRPMDHQIGKIPPQKLESYPREAPENVRYDFTAQDLLAVPDIQRLMADPGLLSLASRYLNASPRADVLSMWWHTDASDVPDKDAAQYWHFDLDRIKWLKVFFYLTDVGADQGAHCFVKGSNRTGALPRSILRKGYARLEDAEVSAAFSDSNLVTHLAPRGTMIIEDTRGLHKGLHVREGDRLMLQLQFSNSLFGAFYKRSRIQEVLSPELEDRLKRYPEVYRNYT